MEIFNDISNVLGELPWSSINLLSLPCCTIKALKKCNQTTESFFILFRAKSCVMFVKAILLLCAIFECLDIVYLHFTITITITRLFPHFVRFAKLRPVFHHCIISVDIPLFIWPQQISMVTLVKILKFSISIFIFT